MPPAHSLCAEASGRRAHRVAVDKPGGFVIFLPMTRLSLSERIEWLQLCRSGGVGPRTFGKLLERFGSARRAYEELPRLMREAGGEHGRRCRRDEAEAELESLQALGAQLIARGEPEYPVRLAEIADPPPLLAVLGDPALLTAPGVAIVGARNASAHGRMLARTLGQELAEAGLVVVSGLARGIDTAAHEGALAAGGGTVAVIASGIDVPYPPENAPLMAEIAGRGAVVSERPPGAVPQARHFPRRNRIIAGLSLGVVVVEAAPQSGSLITARLAAEQGREVMAVPGSPLDPRHRGTNQLLRDGATLVESAADIRAALGALVSSPAPVKRPRRRETRPAAPRPEPVREVAPTAGDLVARLQERLGVEPLLVDELIRQCHATSSEVQQALLELELEGRIERHPGNRVSLASFRPGHI
jgi:DNA processing protein